MEISQMQEIAQDRENLIGFLHISQIKEINSILNTDVSEKSFIEICVITLFELNARLISNRQASIVFEILMEANQSFKIKRFRYDGGSKVIYEYSKAHGAYLFLQQGDSRDFHELERRFGKYVL